MSTPGGEGVEILPYLEYKALPQYHSEYTGWGGCRDTNIPGVQSLPQDHSEYRGWGGCRDTNIPGVQGLPQDHSEYTGWVGWITLST